MKLPQGAVTRRKLSELVPDPRNARRHPEKNLAAIKASLTEFGQVEPLIVRKSTGVVVGGNGRLEAMRALGWETALVMEVDLDDKAAARLGVALNRTAELAEWDVGALSELINDRPGEVPTWGVLGFSVPELEEITGAFVDEARPAKELRLGEGRAEARVVSLLSESRAALVSRILAALTDVEAS